MLRRTEAKAYRRVAVELKISSQVVWNLGSEGKTSPVCKSEEDVTCLTMLVSCALTPSHLRYYAMYVYAVRLIHDSLSCFTLSYFSIFVVSL